MERHAVSRMLLPVTLALLCSAVMISSLRAVPTETSARLIVVVGAPGAEQYKSNFAAQAASWEQVSHKAGARYLTVGLEKEAAKSDLERLSEILNAESPSGAEPLWLVLIGHGTFDGKEAKVNLRGPDLSADQLGKLLQRFTRPMAILNLTSASAPFLKHVTGKERVVVSATRSGNEQSYARLGEMFAKAISDPSSDLDKDQQVSLLEAFLVASRMTADFYKIEGRLATEHPLLEDTGDGLGTPPDWFRGVRATRKPGEGKVDGARARQWHLGLSQADGQLSLEQRAQRNALEQRVFALRDQRESLGEAIYFEQLESLLLQLAKISASSQAPAR